MKQVNKLPNAYLYESIKNIDRLSERVCEFLGIDPLQHALHAVQRRQDVVIIVEESILASQLKYQQKAILTDLRQTFLRDYKTIKIKLSPPKMAQKKLIPSVKILPQAITQLLDQTRCDLMSDD
ncbi:MAG: hypothetical protein ACPG47_04860 [Leucothrix sp.]